MIEKKDSLRMPAPDADMHRAIGAALKAFRTPAATMAELAYTAIPWDSLSLVQAFKTKADVDPELEKSKAAIIDELDELIAKTSDPVIRASLEDAKKKVQCATSLSALTEAVSAAQNVISNASAHIASEQQARRAEINKLWGEIDQLNDENKKDLAALSPYLTDEEKHKEAELEKALKNAKTEEEKIDKQKELSEHQMGIFKRVSEDETVPEEARKRALGGYQRVQETVSKTDEIIEKTMKLKRDAKDASSTSQQPSSVDLATNSTPKAAPAFPAAEANSADKSPLVIPKSTAPASDIGMA
jgi:uncharacterized protein (UPF0147 family)